MASQIFVNLPVKELEKSKQFFITLGYSFNPQFTDEKAACLVLGENIYAMLLKEEFFKSFTKCDIPDPKNSAQVINCISTESREKVDQIADAALANGGSFLSDPTDYGWMYSRIFRDLDGHLWEVMHADMSALPEETK
jgi:uncharacterized protein